jgi:hypothetical protein
MPPRARATRAAEKSADAAAVLASVADKKEIRERQAAANEAVRWKLTSGTGFDDKDLMNQGKGTAYEVIADLASERGDPVKQWGPFGDVGPNQLAFKSLTKAMLTSDRVFTIRWRADPRDPELQEVGKAADLWI